MTDIGSLTVRFIVKRRKYLPEKSAYTSEATKPGLPPQYVPPKEESRSMNEETTSKSHQSNRRRLVPRLGLSKLRTISSVGASLGVVCPPEPDPELVSIT